MIDVRYSVVPNEIEALWAIDLDPTKPADAHINWISLRRTDSEQTDRWWQMLVNPDGAPPPAAFQCGEIKVYAESTRAFLPGDQILPRTPSASGVKYEDGITTFFSKGEEGLLEKDGVRRSCTLAG